MFSPLQIVFRLHGILITISVFPMAVELRGQIEILVRKR